MQIFPRSLDRQVGQASRSLLQSKNQVDVTGQSQDDYHQSFLLKALEANAAFENFENKDPLDQLRWVSAAIRNAKCTAKRKVNKAPIFVGYNHGMDNRIGSNLESRFIQRDLLERVQKAISSGEWKILIQYADADLNAREAWRFSDENLTERGFRKRLTKARYHAQNIIKKICKK